MMLHLVMLSALVHPPAPTPTLVVSPNLAHVARVEDPANTKGGGDGVYGRFDGDFSLRVGLGGEWDAQAAALRPLARLDWVGYQTLGLYLLYRQSVMKSDEALNIASVGISLSPLFLFRWSKALESGHAYGDLLLDSLTLSVGAALGTPRRGSFAEASGLELGLELGLPILPRADGPWLRVRGNLASGRDNLGFEQSWGGGVMLWLDWQFFFHLGLLGQRGD